MTSKLSPSYMLFDSQQSNTKLRGDYKIKISSLKESVDTLLRIAAKDSEEKMAKYFSLKKESEEVDAEIKTLNAEIPELNSKLTQTELQINDIQKFKSIKGAMEMVKDLLQGINIQIEDKGITIFLLDIIDNEEHLESVKEIENLTIGKDIQEKIMPRFTQNMANIKDTSLYNSLKTLKNNFGQDTYKMSSFVEHFKILIKDFKSVEEMVQKNDNTLQELKSKHPDTHQTLETKKNKLKHLETKRDSLKIQLKDMKEVSKSLTPNIRENKIRSNITELQQEITKKIEKIGAVTIANTAKDLNTFIKPILEDIKAQFNNKFFIKHLDEQYLVHHGNDGGDLKYLDGAEIKVIDSQFEAELKELLAKKITTTQMEKNKHNSAFR
jgi:chromosome segregation ATPase